ncbi:MAG: MBL fold metallo-hydrolase [Candidatus Izemoplasmataceae bacterium]
MVEAFFNEFAENSYLLYDDGEAFIIDPGSNTGALKETVDALGVKVKGILLTHGHFDHINGVNILLDTYDVPVYIHEKDRDFLFDPGLNLSIHMGGAAARFKLKDKAKLVTFTEKDTFPLGPSEITVTHTPGHTRGGVLFHYRDVIFTGDTLFKETIGRTDLPTGDEHALLASVRRMGRMIDLNTVLYPGHGPRTTMAHEKLHNFALKAA